MADQTILGNLWVEENAGIGTLSTNIKLEVNSGNANVAPVAGFCTLGAQDFIAISSGHQGNQNPHIFWNRGSLRFATASSFDGLGYSERLRITDSGNVGIGTQSPQVKLHIEGGSAAGLSGGGALAVGALSGNNLALDDSGIMARNNLGTSVLNLQSAGGDLTVHANQAEATMFVVKDTGDVGLGISNPGARLHVNGSVRGNQNGALRIDTGTGYVDIGPQDTQSSQFNTDRSKFYFNKEISVDGGRIGSDNGDLQLRTSGNTRITVQNSTGNVGIGATNPQDTLDLHGALRFNGNIKTRISGEMRGGHNAVVLQGAWDELEVKGRVIDWAGTNLHIGYDNDHAGHYIEIGRKVGFIRLLSGGSTSETMRITGGRVGIGTSSPNQLLDVAGPIAAKQLSVSGSLAAKKISINGGTEISKIQAGRALVGNSGTNRKNIEVKFSSSFSWKPFVVAMARGGNYPDTFSVTTTSVTNTGFKVNVKREDSGGGWGQRLYLDWIAWEIPLIMSPLPGRVVISRTRTP